MYLAKQFVNHKEFQPIERSSSFHMQIEKFDWKLKKSIESKKIQFLDTDNFWWIKVEHVSFDRRAEGLKITFYLATRKSIWESGIWNCYVLGNINGVDFDCTELSIRKEIMSFGKQFGFDKNKPIEMKLVMTISQTDDTAPITLRKCIDTTVQCKKIISNNKCILNGTKFSDFIFVIQGKEFKVHKNILAACSPVFDRLFAAKLIETHTNKCQVVDIEPDIFQYMLNFSYYGELPVNLHEGNISRQLFKAAHYYQMVNICTSVEHYKLSKDNALELYELADTYNLETIKTDAWKIIQFEILENIDGRTQLPVHSVRALIEMKKEKEACMEAYRLNVSKLEAGGSSEIIPAMREPPGMFRDDGKRVDGVTLIPWSKGQNLVWDATCSDTLAPSYLHLSCSAPGKVARKAANVKLNKYKKLLEQNHTILPFAVETLGPWCSEAINFIDTLGNLIKERTGEQKSKIFLKQRIGLALQRSNAASVMGTFGGDHKGLDEIFYILKND